MEATRAFNHTLTVAAKTYAYHGQHETVLEQHVREAHNGLVRNRGPRPLWHDCVTALGGVALALGGQNFIAELSDGRGAFRITAYTVLLLAGVVAILSPRVFSRE